MRCGGAASEVGGNRTQQDGVLTTVHRGMVIGAAALAAVPLLAQRPPEDYPQWRGLRRDGAASAFREPATWPDTLTRRWRVEIGEGYATTLVVDDTAYAFTRRGDAEVLTALDASSGAARWASNYPAPHTPSSPTATHGSGPKATPLFHEDKIFTLVIAHAGNYGPLTAFDADTGAVRWTAGTGGFFMSPLIVTLSGTRQVVSVTQAGVIGVSVTDSQLLWEYPWVGGRMGGTMPVLDGDTIIVSASNTGVSAFRPVRRRNVWTVEPLWDTTDVSMYLSNPVVIDHTLYGLSQRASGQYFALDTRDGAVRWLGPPREALNTAVVKAGDLLFLLNDDAELVIARASPIGFSPLKRYVVADSATWAQPTISGQRIFIKDVSTLTLWGLE